MRTAPSPTPQAIMTGTDAATLTSRLRSLPARMAETGPSPSAAADRPRWSLPKAATYSGRSWLTATDSHPLVPHRTASLRSRTRQYATKTVEYRHKARVYSGGYESAGVKYQNAVEMSDRGMRDLV